MEGDLENVILFFSINSRFSLTMMFTWALSKNRNYQSASSPLASWILILYLLYDRWWICIKKVLPVDFYRFIRCPLLLNMSVQPVLQENHNLLNVFWKSLEMDTLCIILRKRYHFFLSKYKKNSKFIISTPRIRQREQIVTIRSQHAL